MARRKSDDSNDWERIRSTSRLAGALLLAAILALVGWSFNSTLEHDKILPVHEQRLNTAEQEINKLRNDYNGHGHRNK